MVMARVRYCEDCTVTIWVPGTGEQGVAGVTIAARDTLRWSLSVLYHITVLVAIVLYLNQSTSTCSQAESESNPTASLFRDPRLGGGRQWRSGIIKEGELYSLLSFYLSPFLILFFFIFYLNSYHH